MGPTNNGYAATHISFRAAGFSVLCVASAACPPITGTPSGQRLAGGLDGAAQGQTAGAVGHYPVAIQCFFIWSSGGHGGGCRRGRSEEHTSELQSRGHLVCRLLLEKKKTARETKR